MHDPDTPESRNELRKVGRGMTVIGVSMVALGGIAVSLIDHAWASNSIAWGGVFVGLFLIGLGAIVWRDAVFAPPLTPEQRRFREFLYRMGFYDSN